MLTTLDILEDLVQAVGSMPIAGWVAARVGATAVEVVGPAVATGQATLGIPCTSPKKWEVAVETRYMAMVEEEEVYKMVL